MLKRFAAGRGCREDVRIARQAIAIEALSVDVNHPVVRDASRFVPFRFQCPIAVRRGGRENLDDDCRRAFDAAFRDLACIGHDDQVWFDDVVRRQDDVEGRIEHFADATVLEILFKLALQAF